MRRRHRHDRQIFYARQTQLRWKSIRRRREFSLRCSCQRYLSPKNGEPPMKMRRLSAEQRFLAGDLLSTRQLQQRESHDAKTKSPPGRVYIGGNHDRDVGDRATCSYCRARLSPSEKRSEERRVGKE